MWIVERQKVFSRFDSDLARPPSPVECGSPAISFLPKKRVVLGTDCVATAFLNLLADAFSEGCGATAQIKLGQTSGLRGYRTRCRLAIECHNWRAAAS